MRKSHSYWILPFSLLFVENPTFPFPFQRKAHKVFQEISRLSTTFSATNSARMRNQANSQKWPRKFERYSQNRRKSNPSSHSPSKHTNERWIKQDGCFSADVKQSHKRCDGKKSYRSLKAPSMKRRSFSRTSERQGMKLQVLSSALRPSPLASVHFVPAELWQQLWKCDNLNIQVSNTLDLGGQLWEPSTSRQLVFWWCCRDFLRFVRICLDQKRHSNRNPPAVWPNSSPWGVGLGGGCLGDFNNALLSEAVLYVGKKGIKQFNFGFK